MGGVLLSRTVIS